ncbi:MAG: hypothetical protein JZU65_13680, partial [Chlorobium sp.]|nr:hypothetical protein [Chlorobium sp.]
TDTLDSCNTTPLTYAWNVDNTGGYDYFTANPTISYTVLNTVLGVGTHTMTFKVTDSNGGVGIGTAVVIVGSPVALSAPADGAVFNLGEPIAFAADVTALSGVTITTVQFFDGATLLGTDAIAPYSFTWAGATTGAHSLTAVVTLSSGAAVSSASVSIYVTDGSPATMATPTAGTVLSGSSQTFTWNYAGASNYQFRVGTSQGAYDIALADLPGTTTSTSVNNLPTNGSTTLYVRLYSQINSTWVFNDYTYTAATPTLTPATIYSPANSSTLAGASQTFTWNDVGASNYQFRVGTSQGAYDIALADLPGTTTSTSVNNLPTNGSTTLYVRLYSLHGSTWVFNDFTYISGP